MKRLTDYKGEDAIDLWGKIIESASAIITDPEIQKAVNEVSAIVLAGKVIKTHKKEISEILLSVDDTPIDAQNLVSRTLVLLDDIGKIPEAASFFGLQGQNETKESSGSATANTEETER